MNNDIKEILEELKEKNETYKECSENEIIENEYYKSHILYDYITKLQEIVYNLTTMTANGDRTQIKNTAQYKLELAQDRIDKAIEHLHKRYEQNNSALTNKEETIISKHELLKLENINNKILEDILRGNNDN